MLLYEIVPSRGPRSGRNRGRHSRMLATGRTRHTIHSRTRRSWILVIVNAISPSAIYAGVQLQRVARRAAGTNATSCSDRKALHAANARCRLQMGTSNWYVTTRPPASGVVSIGMSSYPACPRARKAWFQAVEQQAASLKDIDWQASPAQSGLKRPRRHRAGA